MWMVTKITTVNEADYAKSGTRAVTTEQPEGLSFPEWRRQHLDGWEQFHQAATEDDGRVYGFARKDPETTVWLWVKHQEDTPEEVPEGEESLPGQIARLLAHLQREVLTEEDKLESLRHALAVAWSRGHTAAMEEGFDLPNLYNF